MPTKKVSRVVLLVDDEPAILDLMHAVLTRDGHATLQASHGDEALRLADRYDGPIDLLVTDIVMPAMTGFALAAELRGRRPDARVLLLSGHLDDRAEVLQGLARAPYPYLLKPFSAKELGDKVQGVLTTPTAPAAPTAYERRREPRHPIRLPVQYRIDGTETWLKGSALDLSDCGILLEPAEPLEPNCRIEISINLPKAAHRRRAGLMTRVGYVTRQAAASRADFCPVGVFVMF
jgi:DNA-binding response OmpR family regulator